MSEINFLCVFCNKSVPFGKKHLCMEERETIKVSHVDTKCVICKDKGYDTTTDKRELDLAFSNCLCNFCYETNSKELKL